MVTAVSSPTPKIASISVWQPGCLRAYARRSWSNGISLSSIASITLSAIVSCSRAAAGRLRPASHSRCSAVSRLRCCGTPVVIEHRVHPLLPLGPLMGEQMPGPDPGAQIENVRRRDPRLREAPDQKQLPQMPGVGPVGLRTLLLALQRGRLRGLGQVYLRPDPVELLDHEPPARRRLQRDLETLVDEPAQERSDRGAVRRRHPRARDLPGDRVDPLRRELRPMLIQTHHDRHAHTSPFDSPASPGTRQRAASSPTHRIPWDTVGTSYSNGRPRGRNPRAPTTPFDAEDRPPSSPDHVNRDITSFAHDRASGSVARRRLRMTDWSPGLRSSPPSKHAPRP